MFKLLKKITLASLFTLVLLNLQGCIATAIVSTAAVATKVATDPRTAGRQLDDETLEEKVAYQLNKDGQLQEESRINVIAYNGKILLVGQAPNESAKETAQSIAAGVEGVKEIYNEIRIGEKISAGQISKDSWITTKIKSKLLINAEVKTTDVKVITENGEAFLIGTLSNTQANAAAEVASHVDGVRKVIKVIQTVQ